MFISPITYMDSNSKKRFWDLKPYWCQPWSIITFGILVLTFSWKIFNNIIIFSITALFEADKNLTSFQKNLGVSNKEAYELNNLISAIIHFDYYYYFRYN